MSRDTATPGRPAWWTVVLLLATVGIFGGGIGVAVDRSDSSHAGQPSPAATTSYSVSATAQPTPSTSAAPADPDLFTPPATFTWISDDAAGTGKLDVIQAAKLDGSDPQSQTGLQQLGFVRGVSRQWQADSLTLVDLVYTFGQPDQAAAYVNTAIAKRRSDPAYVLVAAPSGAPAGAAVFSRAANGRNSLVILFPSGSHAIIMGLVTSSGLPTATQIAALAQQQAAISAVS